ncbi:MAG: FtsQ-type POTRA domain-containing protein [Kiritimatiellales bacterium]|nr:FtsQ-type POTRA domain-containing protein [Kiritimatiellota bacterium]MBL7015983.1 FtsQ-type POTRA domain-containing protein [Kiritimatiellales bacterium]
MAAKRGTKRRYHARTKASKETAARRGILISLTVVFGLVVLFGVFQALAYTGSLFFSRNPYFELKHILIRSDGRLSSSQLMEYAKLETGVNLFDVDFDTLQADLEAVPLVQSVRIQRKLPDTLVVDVSERTAVAQVSWKWRSVPFLIDREGVVLPPTRTGQALPLIEGVKLDQLRPGEQITDPGVQYALELLTTCDAMRFSSQIGFERFDLRYPDHITATLTGNINARFPRQAAREKLIRLARVMEIAREQGRRIKTVDLTPDGLNVPTTDY